MPGRGPLIPEYVPALVPRLGFGFRRRVAPAFILFALLAGLETPRQELSGAPMSAPLEFGVRAAFLLNFTKFIDWPPTESPEADSPFTICILGDDPFGTVLDQTVQNETVNGRRLVVERIERAPSGRCKILYISRSERGIKGVVEGLGPGVLTVGEGDSFVQDGGMIAFVLENRRVRFKINLSAARNGMLTFSSRLLAVASAVEK